MLAPCVVCGRRAGVVPFEWVEDVDPRRRLFACFPCATVDLDEE